MRRSVFRRGRRRARAVIWSLVAVVLTGTALGAVVLRQNSYEIREEKVSIRHGETALDGVLALPPDHRGRGPFGLVVFVHGDGPVDATHETFYRPIWESLARAGYASLSWNKPGVAGSEGQWLDQTMTERARETSDAIAWATRQRPDIDTRRIGLWGASQAGWVLPKVAAQAPGVRFVIAVSPAVDWRRQGRYNLLAELRANGASPEDTATALRRRQTTLDLLDRQASYEEYVRAVGDPQGVTAARWRFIARNYTSDATADLRAMPRIPVLLVLAGHDVNVDVADTETTYRNLLPASHLRVLHYPDAGHSLVKHAVEQSPARLYLTAVLAPKALFADGFLTGQQRFLERLDADGDLTGTTG